MQYFQHCKQPDWHKTLRKDQKQSKVAKLWVQISAYYGSNIYIAYTLQEILESMQENSPPQRSEQLKLWNPFQYQVEDE